MTYKCAADTQMIQSQQKQLTDVPVYFKKYGTLGLVTDELT